MPIKRVTAVLCILFSFTSAAVAQNFTHYYTELLGRSGFHENYEIRRLLKDDLFAMTPAGVSSPRRVFTQITDDQRVEFDIRRSSLHFYLCFVNEQDFRFPLLSRGTWIIKKEIGSGRFVQAKVFLLPDEGSFVRFFPFEERSRMDIYLYGERLYQDIPLPFAFEQLLTMPFSRLVSLTKESVDWQTLMPDAGWDEWQWVRNLVADIREKLDEIPDAEDGALSKEGRYVRIETGEPFAEGETAGMNCSGFVKWVGDALYRPLAGESMAVADLKKKWDDYRGNSWSATREDLRDPYFGLDWTRNIAAHIYKASYGSFPDNPEATDLREVPFFTYKEDLGYPAEQLAPVLFQAASRNPGAIYLASVNTPFLPEGEQVVLRQHVHVAVLLPYMDREGDFHVIVLDRNRESTLEQLVSMYDDAYIHLTRLPLRHYYDLPILPPVPGP